MPLKIKFEDFQDVTEGSERFLHRIDGADGKYHVLVATSQYFAEVTVDGTELEEVKKWLGQKHSIEVIGYVDWQNTFRTR